MKNKLLLKAMVFLVFTSCSSAGSVMVRYVHMKKNMFTEDYLEKKYPHTNVWLFMAPNEAQFNQAINTSVNRLKNNVNLFYIETSESKRAALIKKLQQQKYEDKKCFVMKTTTNVETGFTKEQMKWSLEIQGENFKDIIAFEYEEHTGTKKSSTHYATRVEKNRSTGRTKDTKMYMDLTNDWFFKTIVLKEPLPSGTIIRLVNFEGKYVEAMIP